MNCSLSGHDFRRIKKSRIYENSSLSRTLTRFEFVPHESVKLIDSVASET